MATSRRLALTSSSVFASLRRFRRPSGPRRDFRKTNEFAAQARMAVQWSGEFLPKPATAVYGFEDPRHPGAGYIGSHTCKALAAVGFDNLSTGHRDRWNLVKEFGVGAVIHFAAHAYQFGNVRNISIISKTLALFNTLLELEADISEVILS